MDKASLFFRVFDIAFFAPGTVLFLALRQARWLPDGGLDKPLGTAGGTLAVLFAIATIYGLGLICHGVQRWIEPYLQRLFGTAPTGPTKSWYETQNAVSPRQELAFYFWYLRATCWNLSVALLLTLCILAFPLEQPPAPGLLRVVGTLAGIVVLARLGHDFQSALRRAAN